MSLFKSRKKNENEVLEKEHLNMIEELSKPPCQRKNGKHMYRDFPPYLTYEWNGARQEGKIRIIEKYVCCYCQEVSEKTLEVWSYTNYSQKDFFKEVEEYKEKYKGFIQPRAIVEDMINDAIMVDRQKLSFWDMLHAPEPPKKETFKMTIPEKLQIHEPVTVKY